LTVIYIFWGHPVCSNDSN